MIYVMWVCPCTFFSILWVLSLSICLSFLQRKFRQGTVSPVHFYFPVLQFLTSPVSAVMATSCPRGCTKWHHATTQGSQHGRQGSALPSLMPTVTMSTCQGLPIFLFAGGEQPIEEESKYALTSLSLAISPSPSARFGHSLRWGGGGEMFTTCKWWKCSLFIHTSEEGWRGKKECKWTDSYTKRTKCKKEMVKCQPGKSTHREHNLTTLLAPDTFLCPLLRETGSLVTASLLTLSQLSNLPNQQHRPHPCHLSGFISTARSFKAELKSLRLIEGTLGNLTPKSPRST